MIHRQVKRTVLVLLLVMTFTFYSYAEPAFNSEGNSQVLLLSSNKTKNMIIDFTKPHEITHWRIVNDDVMGGNSRGFLSSSGNYGVFSGNISLENNGGFSSTLRSIKPLEQGLNYLVIDIEGDGLSYQLRAIVFLNGYRLAYKHDFDTKKGKREKLRLSLVNFKASFRGRIIKNAPLLVSENIAEIGLLITNKTEGAYSLNIHSIEAQKDDTNKAKDIVNTKNE